MSARLECPLCGHVVAEGVDDIAPGTCAGCEARYEGGVGDAPGAVAQALADLGVGDLEPREVLDAVFRLTPDESREQGVSVTSDQRDDFYRWWLFVRPAPGGDARAVLAQVVGR